MPWDPVYNNVFGRLHVPHGWHQLGGGNYDVDSARAYAVDAEGSIVWVGFSGAGNANSRSLKIERYVWSFGEFGGPEARLALALGLREALAAQGLEFQSGHNVRRAATPCVHGPGACLWATTAGGALVHSPHRQHNGVAVTPAQVGVEHAGLAGRVVAWRPQVLTRANANAHPPEVQLEAAATWLNAAMAALG
jgi:hypothetical protein